MGKFIARHWHSELGTGLSRKDRRSCEYMAYAPDALARRAILLDGDVAADVADAERALTRLDHDASALVDTEGLARILLRAESVASSKIEGLEVGARRLLRAEMARESDDDPRDVTATEVLGNIAAMAWALTAIDDAGEVSVDLLLEVHRRLLAGTRQEEHAGAIRSTQNWIG